MIVDAQREARALADQTQRLKRHAEGLTTGADVREIPDIAQWVARLREINNQAGGHMATLVGAGMSDEQIGMALPWIANGAPIANPTSVLTGAVMAGEVVIATYRSEGIEAAVQGPCYGPLPDDRVSPHPVLTVDVSALKPSVQLLIDALPI